MEKIQYQSQFGVWLKKIFSNYRFNINVDEGLRENLETLDQVVYIKTPP